jgi:hypothetical protein
VLSRSGKETSTDAITTHHPRLISMSDTTFFRFVKERAIDFSKAKDKHALIFGFWWRITGSNR